MDLDQSLILLVTMAENPGFDIPPGTGTELGLMDRIQMMDSSPLHPLLVRMLLSLMRLYSCCLVGL